MPDCTIVKMLKLQIFSADYHFNIKGSKICIMEKRKIKQIITKDMMTIPTTSTTKLQQRHTEVLF